MSESTETTTDQATAQDADAPVDAVASSPAEDGTDQIGRAHV